MTALVAGLSDADAARTVPTCPAWTVREVVAHLVGVAVDNTTGNMAGAPSEAWTGAHIAARRGRPVAELLAEWDAVAPAMEASLQRSMAGPPVFDVACHEQDIRTALDRPGDRDNDAIAWCVGRLVPRFAQAVSDDALPAVRVRLDGNEQMVGEGEPALTLDATTFDFFRGSLGRRSAGQFASYFSGGDPAPYLERLIIFGPATVDIQE